jgi:glycosyltransferase involved in cell wall biosynthesis
MHEKLVSIVVPTYNHASLVGAALRSVADQTYGTLELIVVDDASTDGTFGVVEQLASTDAFRRRFEGRIRLERNAFNEGAHTTLNRAVGLASGELVAILNSDDRYAPDRISAAVAALTEAAAELAFTGVRMIDAQDRDVTTTDPFCVALAETQRRIPECPTVGFALLERNLAISTGNLVFCRSLFDRAGGFRALAYCHDWDFVLRCVLHTEPVYLPERLYDYRVHATNSFRALDSVRDRESSFVLRSYFAAVRRGNFPNELAPAPSTWPGVFEDAIARSSLETFWDRSRPSPA